ncbi:putative O-linked N-acetylglucosamine transferase, SPINDLY family [Sulfitobacter noctilucae]|uniref:hypothetical protein n=1 Tax=Sulfitobacter noctilucae TaxID=1342302 RepID=UPI000469B6CB|nr:hypothetical protein [Sulfitobacter noctilucae]KIN70656.1 putative O-linked N-acetylglucosamine transferase, SPINDLY family [Sulfitobacter noctilucae]
MEDTNLEVERPKLTFIPEVQDLVRHHYEKAKVILEYGSGGSTVMASEMPGKTIYSVESSRVWTKMMKRWFEQANPVSMPEMQHVNIGPTGKWGTPIDSRAYQRYSLYPLSIWDKEDFKHPDVILVDGRFRVACALTAMLKCTKKTTLLFDDYEGRKGYKVLEEFLEKEETVGRMSRFTVGKTALPRKKMTQIIGMYAQHF